MRIASIARSSPIVNTSPLFSSVFAVLLLGEVWVAQNVIGTLLVILGVVILSLRNLEQAAWQMQN